MTKIPAVTGQILRFIAIGFMNTGVDFLTLNLLIFSFGLEAGDHRFTIFKVISFAVAALNSFFWNRFWVFRKEADQKHDTPAELLQFTVVTVLSFLLNIGTATAVFHFVTLLSPNIPTLIGANIGALTGSIVSFSTNFFGYKYFVFKK